MPSLACPQSAVETGARCDERSDLLARSGANLVPRDESRRLVLRELGDTTRMPLLVGEWLGDEGVNELFRLVDRVLASSDGDDVRVVVCASQHCSVMAPDERRSNPRNLVRSDLFTVAGAPKHDPEALNASGLIGGDSEAGIDAERRVIVERVISRGTVINDIVTARAKVALQVVTEL